MQESHTDYYYGIDIGSSQVRCVVARTDSDGWLSIVGQGSAPNIGMRKGMVVHVDEVANAIVAAKNEAERLSGVPIDRATINVNGSLVGSLNSRGVVAISTPNREISLNDRLRVEEAATILKLPPNREIIQVFAKNYRLDGQDNIKDPVGMQGVRLEVDTHIVTASSAALKLLEAALEQAGVAIAHRTVSGLAAAEAVLSRQQKEVGTLIVDIGAGTTNMAVIEDGEVQHVAILPIGGSHITNDLAIGLRTDLDVAEAVKIEGGGLAGAVKKGVISVKIKTEKYEFPGDEVAMIIEARVEELFEYVDKELRKIGRSRKLPGGVVLVGGSAKLPGIADQAKETLQLAARVGRLQGVSGLVETVSDPSYYPVVGLCMLDLFLQPIAGHTGHDSHRQAGTLLGMVDGLLKKVRRR